MIVAFAGQVPGPSRRYKCFAFRRHPGKVGLDRFIPRHSDGHSRRDEARSPESITTGGSNDSGPAPVAHPGMTIGYPGGACHGLAQPRTIQITCDPIRSHPFQSSLTMRLFWQALAVVLVFPATPSGAEPYGSRLLQHVRNSRPIIAVANEDKRELPDTDILALPSGKCSTLKIAGRDFACRAVAFFQNEQGRANFAIALDDPMDGSHIVTFSGDNGRREKMICTNCRSTGCCSTPRTGQRSMACRCRWSSCRPEHASSLAT